jgi:RNA polymerase sigma factor (TIGR02999 family)
MMAAMGTNESIPAGDERSTHPQAGPPPLTSLEQAVYRHLRAIAAKRMSQERIGHTLTPTALVSEAFLRLGPDSSELAPANRAAFYNAAAQAMRHILIDHARRRGADKRGGGQRRSSFDVANVIDLADPEKLELVLALDDALMRLEEEDPGAASVVRLRFYAGLTGEQAAETLGISPRQVDREWAFARAFLLRQLKDPREGGEGGIQP